MIIMRKRFEKGVHVNKNAVENVREEEQMY